MISFQLKNLWRVFPRDQKKPPKFKIKKKGWWGINPSGWDKFYLILGLLFILFGMLGTVVGLENLQRYILYSFVYKAEDIWITGHGFGLIIPGMFLGISLSQIIFDLFSETTLRVIQKCTGQSKSELIPAIAGQSRVLGVDEKKFRKFIYKITLILFVTCIPGFFSYTLFSSSEIIERKWPGLIVTTKGYEQVVNVWKVESYRNNLSGQIEPLNLSYAIEFSDGNKWTSSSLPFSTDKFRISIEKLMELVAQKAEVQIVPGVRNIDI